MSDHPIIFSAPMIRALLDGRKTMTRRLAWGKQFAASDEAVRLDKGWHHDGDGFYRKPSPRQRVKPGDLLWVREAHYRYGRWIKDGVTKSGRQRWRFRAAATAKVPDNTCVYYMDEPPSEIAAKGTDLGWHKRPSIFMPRWASRLTLTVTATKIERLQDISEDDARAEGCERAIAGNGEHGVITTYRTGFVHLWGSLHGTESWLANPDVVAVTFSVHRHAA